MKKDPYWIVLPGLIWFVASIGAYLFTKEAYLLLSIGASFIFVLTSLYVVRHQAGDAPDAIERIVASNLSMIPGFGHIYLGRFVPGLLFIGCSLIDIVCFLSVFQIETSKVMLVGFSSMVILIALIGYSMIDVDRICTQLKLEGDAAYNLKLRNHNKAFAVWTVIIVIALTIAILFSLSS